MQTQSVNSLCLTFSSSCPPYAEVACHLLTKSAIPLRIGLNSDHNSTTSLTIPAKLFNNTTTETIHGSESIVRFLTRTNTTNTLFESNSIADIVAINQSIESLKSIKNEESINDLILSANGPWISNTPTLSIADLLTWSKLKSLQSSSLTLPWISKIESLEEIKETLIKVQYAMDSASVTDFFKQSLVKMLVPILQLSNDVIYRCITTQRNSLGSYCLPIPQLKIPGNPVQIAVETQAAFTVNNVISKCTVSGVFMNFFVSENLLRDMLLPQILKMGKEYGSNASGFGKMAVVEYSSPNIAKPFHAGHLRSTIIGNFVRNVLQANGWRTVSINYLGDWGKQYGLLALGFLKYGSRQELEKDAIRHLFDVYVQINKDAKEDPNVDAEAKLYFKKMEEGDQETLALWSEFRDLSIVKYKQIYERINVAFDIYSGESQYSLEQMRKVMKELEDLELLDRENGARIINFKTLTPAIIEKSDGSMLYLSRDIAAAIDRHEVFSFDRMFYIVGNQQDYHFKQLFKILEMMGKPWAGNCTHLNFGLIKSKNGNMSTRNGSVVFLEDILNTTKEEMHGAMKLNEKKYAQIQDPEHVSDLVGISSIVIQDMFAKRHKDYEFDWNRMISFEGDTGPYLQYAHARLCSIERMYLTEFDPSKVNLTLLKETHAHVLIDCISQYPVLVQDCYRNFEPNAVVVYAFELSHRVSSAIENLWVKGEAKDVAEARMVLYMCARITLGNLLQLLGLKPLTRM